MMASQDITASTWQAAFEEGMVGRRGLPGYVYKPKESLAQPPMDRTFVEHCRVAFSNLSRLAGHGGVVAVVSPHRREGRSAVAAGLGLALAHDLESLSLIVDLDISQPGQGVLFDVPDTPGLTDYLEGDSPLRLVGGGTNRRLWLLTAGTAVADHAARLAHVLGGGAFFSGCRETFAWTIVDLPPLLDSTEAAYLCGLADVCLLVGRYRHTSIYALTRASALIPAQRPTGFLMSANSSRVPGWINRLL
jgi:Mrp family chromosome partitioning ATPase